MSSPFANSFRRLGDSAPQQSSYNNGIMGRLGNAQTNNPFAAAASEFTRTGQITRPQEQRSRPANPFEDNEQYQAMMEYRNSMGPNEEQRTQMQSLMESMQPNQEQRDRMGELRTAFEGTGGFKDYRIQQMEQQMNQMRNQRQGRMGGGLGSQRPQGMGMYGGFPQRPQQMPQGIMGGYGRPQQNPYGGGMQGGYGQQPQQMRGFGQNPNNFSGGYGQQPAYQQQRQQQMPQPQYQPYQNPYQQSQPQPQQYGGYGMGQSQGGFGGYGGMSNPYQPQQQNQPQQQMPQAQYYNS
jgi:hypothetical protein